jgi:sugar/nucleoside kinase (ribokinase family)
MTEKEPIICLGILVADVVGRPVIEVPAPGRLSLVEDMGLYTGGCAVNAASALARLGLPVEVVGKVGDDPFGDFVIQALTGRGIGSQGIKRDSRSGTSATMVMVGPDGERRFIHYLGANARFTLDDVDLAQVQSGSILHIAGAFLLPGIDGEPAARLLEQARLAGVTTFMDTAWDAKGRWMSLLKPCLPHLDYFIPSLPEAVALTGRDDPEDAARALLDEGVGIVGIKMDVQGCLVLTRQGERFRTPAYKVQAVDSTGAGDAFAAGFIAGVWFGWPLEQVANFANAVGALCVTAPGASGGTLPLAETLQFMENTPQYPLPAG